MSTLSIKNLHVEIEGKKILKGVNLEIKENEIHAIMGPNGNGKSTLLSTLMGHPKYEVTEGEILLDGENVLEMEVDERSRAGLFLAMQYPQEISGVTNADFLRAAVNAHRETPLGHFKFHDRLNHAIDQLKMRSDMASRFVNDGFSGGEKKRNEILQMLMLQPEICMLDEIDSGLDVDALKIVADAINQHLTKQASSFLIVSHYERFFHLVHPTHTHIMLDGKIVMSGDEKLVYKVDAEGYDWLKTTEAQAEENVCK